MLGLTYQITCVHHSTVWRAVKKFETEGSVYSRGPQTLTDAQMFTIIEVLLENPDMYLREVKSCLLQRTGSTVAESSVCRFVQRNNFSRRKLQQVARQRMSNFVHY